MRKALRYLLYPLVFISLSGVSAYLTMKILTSGMTVQVPDLKGRTMQEADKILDEVGLYVRTENEAYDLKLPAGSIVSQDLPAGSPAKKGGEIKVVVSKGPEIRLIPSLLGKSMNEAGDLLSGKKIEISKVISVHSDSMPEGFIIAQRPVPEEWAGEPVVIVVSSGPYDVIYYCPNFIGMTRNEAVGLAYELGIDTGFSGPSTGQKTVTGQTPAPGSEIQKGDTVYLQF